MEIVKTILKRSVALVILKVSGVLAAGSIAGVELWQSALVAAFVGVMEVAESLSRAYVVDGVLDADEINIAFASSAEAEVARSKKASDLLKIRQRYPRFGGGFLFSVTYVMLCSYIKTGANMAKGKGGGGKPPVKGSNDGRNNGKANKKRPKIFDAIKRRLVNRD